MIDDSLSKATCELMRRVYLRAAARVKDELGDHYDGPKGIDRDLLEKQRDEYKRLAKCCEDERDGRPMPDEREPWER